MEIRFAKAQDIPEILALLRQVGQLQYPDRPDIFRSGAQKYGASQVLSMLDNPAAPVFVAAEADRILGYCFCQIKAYRQDPVIADHTSLYIDDLCVDASSRGQHIGTQLYQAVCKYARQRRCHCVALSVWTCNTAAVKFFESLGLKPQKIEMEDVLEDA